MGKKSYEKLNTTLLYVFVLPYGDEGRKNLHSIMRNTAENV